MTRQANFEEDGTVYWDEPPRRKPLNGPIQGAMFLDRPDLWPVRRRRRPGSSPHLPNQPALIPPESL